MFMVSVKEILNGYKKAVFDTSGETPESRRDFINKSTSVTTSTDNDLKNNSKKVNYKTVAPEHLYKPPYGYPLNKNVWLIRDMARTPYVGMITNTAINEIAGMDWRIRVKDGASVPDSVIQMTKDWFYNPNVNNENLGSILRKYVRDIIELDAGVIVKNYNFKGEFHSIFARDGGLFLKAPDMYGVMPSREDNRFAYYQYSWYSGRGPIGLYNDEVVYTSLNPLSNSVYGLSNVEILLNTLRMLNYGVISNLEFYTNNNIPKGVLSLQGADGDAVDGFSKQFNESQSVRDEGGFWRKLQHKIPVINSIVKFERMAFSNVEMQDVERQKWFIKIVLATFGINENELGFTEDSNKAVAVAQSSAFKRKFIRPLVEAIEYAFNTQLVNDLPWVKGRYENEVIFEFDKYDLGEDLAKRALFEKDINLGISTVNEVREELHKKPVEGGDEIKSNNTININSLDEARVGARDDRDKVSEKEVSKSIDLKALDSASSLTLSGFETTYKKLLSNLEKDVLVVLDRYVPRAEVKALDNSVIKSISSMINFDGLKFSVIGLLKGGYVKGIDSVEQKLNRNFLVDKNSLDFLSNYTFDNVKGLEKEVREDVRQVLQRGLLNGTGVSEVKRDLKKVFDVADNRLKMIARTELNRASNMGSLDGYKQSGLKGKKRLVAELDKDTSEICRHLNGKSVGLNDDFEYNGKSWPAPPFHPNCRSTIVFERE